MNTQSNAVPESPLGTQGIAPAAMSETRPMYWSVRRELWENRSIYIAPLAVAAVTVFGFLIATIGRAMSTTDLAQRRAVLEEPYTFAMFLIMGAAFVVGIFYSLDALHGERRDRSILFWKSLPVSDLTTVLSKASIPLVILPLFSFALTVATQLIMLLLGSTVLLASGLSAAPLWTRVPLFQMWMMLLYHMVAVHMIWYPLAIGIVEKLAFNTKHFASMMQYRFSGSPEAVGMPGSLKIDPMTHLTPGHFLSSPGLWTGLIVAAIFLAVTVRLRRYQGPI